MQTGLVMVTAHRKLLACDLWVGGCAMQKVAPKQMIASQNGLYGVGPPAHTVICVAA